MRRLATILFASALTMGCHREAAQDRPTTRPSMLGMSAQAPIAAPAKSLPIQEGEPPLAYRVPSDGTVRIVDMNTSADVAVGALKAGEFIAVTQDNGILFGSERMLKGPLPEGHRYGIFIDQPSSNIYRSGAVIPGSR